MIVEWTYGTISQMPRYCSVGLILTWSGARPALVFKQLIPWPSYWRRWRLLEMR